MSASSWFDMTCGVEAQLVGGLSLLSQLEHSRE